MKPQIGIRLEPNLKDWLTVVVLVVLVAVAVLLVTN